MTFMWEITEPRQALHRSRRVDRRRPARCCSTSCAAPTCSSPTCSPARGAASGVDVDDLFAVNGRLIYARATGHGDRGPRTRCGRLRPHRLLGAHGHRPRGEPGVRRVRAAGRPRVGRSHRRRVPRRRDRGRARSGASVPVAARSSTCRCCRRACGCSRPAWWRASSTTSTPSRACAMRDLPNPLVAAYRTSDDRLIYCAGMQTEAPLRELLRGGRRAPTCSPTLASRPARPRLRTRRRMHRDPRRDLRRPRPRRVASRCSQGCRRRGRSCRPRRRRAATSAGGRQRLSSTDVEGGKPRLPARRQPRAVRRAAPTSGRAPDHGEHTEAVLLELGRDWDEILRLKSEGVVL